MKIRKTHKGKVLGFFSDHKVAALVVAGVLIVAGVGTAVYFVVFNNEPKGQDTATEQAKEPEPEPIVYYANLTGRVVETEAEITAPVTAIMIENSPEARPQSGLKNSGIVFEAIAEGGITRFLVLYQSEKPKLVGPVRSLRSYYVDWLTPYQASVVHCGGSSASLALVRNGKYRDIDEFFNEKTYWRADDRWAPHDLYTSFSRIDKLNKERGYKESTFTGFARKDDSKLEEAKATRIDVTISSSTFNSSYKYDSKTNTYLRSQAGAAHKDREEGRIAPNVVIAMIVQQRAVMEDGYREQIVTTGKGTAYIFQDGDVVEGTWSKANRGAPLEFFDKSGKAVSLNRGQTWITAVPKSGGDVKWKQ